MHVTCGTTCCPTVYVAAAVGVLTTIVGGLRSTCTGPRAPTVTQLPAASHTFRDGVVAGPSEPAARDVASLNDASATSARPMPSSTAEQWIVTLAATQPVG